jgi:hypothetical protein
VRGGPGGRGLDINVADELPGIEATKRKKQTEHFGREATETWDLLGIQDYSSNEKWHISVLDDQQQ